MGCFGCLKYVLIIFAVGYLLVGLGLLAVSLWMRFDLLKEASDALSQRVDSDYMTIALYIAMGIGAFLVLLGILGCVGALRISLCLLGNFAVLVVAAIGGLIAICVLAYIYQDDILKFATTGIMNFMANYGQSPGHSGVVDGIQRALKCCGGQFPADWVSEFKRSIPASCCRNTNACIYGGNVNPIGPINLNTVQPQLQPALPTLADVAASIGRLEIFPQGCAEKLRSHYREAMQIIVGLSGGIAGFMLLGFILVIAFCCVM